MIIHNLIILSASSAMFIAYHTNMYELFLVGRFLCGRGRAFSWFTPIFLAEVAPEAHRGTASLLTGVSVHSQLSNTNVFIHAGRFTLLDGRGYVALVAVRGRH